MTSTDGGGYHKSGSAERCSPPPINTHHRYLHVEILQLCPMKLETWCRSSLVSSYSCSGWMGSGQAQELAFDLTSFSLTNDASSLLLALPESSLPEICELYCTQEQNISLSFYRRGAAYFQGQKSSITQMKPGPLHLGRENQIPSLGKGFQSLLHHLSSATIMLHRNNHQHQWPALVNI